MNAVMENLLGRRSCRSFTSQTIPGEILSDILDAALYAPSGMDAQIWQFTVLRNAKTIATLARLIEEELARQGFDMYKPSLLIIPSNLKNSRFGKEDNACAMENMFLAAHSHGIGSVWLNQMQTISDAPPIRKFLDSLGIPANHEVYGIAAFGYPASPLPPATPRKGIVRFAD